MYKKKQSHYQSCSVYKKPTPSGCLWCCDCKYKEFVYLRPTTKRIPVKVYEEIKITIYEPGTAAGAMQSLRLAFDSNIKWIDGVPYNVQIQTTVPKD